MICLIKDNMKHNNKNQEFYKNSLEFVKQMKKG